MLEVLECAPQARISPRRVFLRHAYNELTDALRRRWTPPNNGCRGGQPHYANLAIVTALTLRLVFHLPLRQTEGFLNSLLRLMELDLKTPDHCDPQKRRSNIDGQTDLVREPVVSKNTNELRTYISRSVSDKRV